MVFTIVMVATVDKIDRSFLGLRFYIVQTDSMSLSENNADDPVHFNAGDIIFSKKVKDATALEDGAIISFISTNSDSHGKILTHKIRCKEYNSDDIFLGYTTYGTNKGVDDQAIVSPNQVLGEYMGKLAGVGTFFAFVKTTPGYFLCILSPFLLLIIFNAINVIRSAKAYKAEQRAVADAERADIEEKIRENKELLEKLEALKKELEEKNGDASPKDPTEQGSE